MHRIHSGGTSGKSQDASRAVEVGTQLRRWDGQTTQNIASLASIRSELASAYADIPSVISDPTIRAELQQEFRDVDTKIVHDTQDYANGLVPLI